MHVLVGSLKRHLDPSVNTYGWETDINDPAFAVAMAECAHRLNREGQRPGIHGQGEQIETSMGDDQTRRERETGHDKPAARDAVTSRQEREREPTHG